MIINSYITNSGKVCRFNSNRISVCLPEINRLPDGEVKEQAWFCKQKVQRACTRRGKFDGLVSGQGTRDSRGNLPVALFDHNEASPTVQCHHEGEADHSNDDCSNGHQVGPKQGFGTSPGRILWTDVSKR